MVYLQMSAANLEIKCTSFSNYSGSIKEVIKIAQELWKNIPQSFINKLYEGMPKRMKKVISNKGNPIKY